MPPSRDAIVSVSVSLHEYYHLIIFIIFIYQIINYQKKKKRLLKLSKCNYKITKDLLRFLESSSSLETYKELYNIIYKSRNYFIYFRKKSEGGINLRKYLI